MLFLLKIFVNSKMDYNCNIIHIYFVEKNDRTEEYIKLECSSNTSVSLVHI